MTLWEITLNSPLIWILSISLMVRHFTSLFGIIKEARDEKQYYHDLHKTLEEIHGRKPD